ncbi:hypothetical protein IV494_04160 [Kaistella sp. G5-32]|uniref:Intein n=1 Tax=Kaistella gelatinilytica TaxID=2787636 RepID=A0ABS0F9J6_9FLAO|nr:hypothetical protein [Kaistella gelatinilytica]MBF8456368.1 hypothetical protein [Kaistella gelatinilytica]
MKIFLLISIFASFLVKSQIQDQSRYYDFVGKRVLINKSIVAYSVSESTIVAGKIQETTHNTPSEKNPFIIYISSTDDNASIRINNKNFREDIIYTFQKLYKMKASDSKYEEYNFINGKCDAGYLIPKNNEHQSLIISCLDSKKDGFTVQMTISQFDEL